MSLKVSIIVNTYNRCDSLKRTLDSFSYIRYPNFEVIVVNGPSTDGTADLLSAYDDVLKLDYCPETNLSVSRNIGISRASGDILCFIDDDGIPEPDWLDALLDVFSEGEDVGAVGGFVRDHTGIEFQSKYIVCDRSGNANFFGSPADFHVDEFPGSREYFSVIGVNSAFRRAALLEVGGFDEEYAYFLDETDVCVRLVDAGWKVRFAPNAEVHHKYAPSHLRNHNRVPTSLYYSCRSKVYFQFKNSVGGEISSDIFRAAVGVRNEFKFQVDNLKRLGAIRNEQFKSLYSDIDRGFRDGIVHFYENPSGRHISNSCEMSGSFFPFRVTLPSVCRIRIILISQEYPPNICGGVGVFINTLAIALANNGHEVSVITKSDGAHTVDFEDGVWVHRIPDKRHGNRAYPIIPDLPGQARDHAFSVFDEAIRIQARRGASITLSAIWDLEAAACVASGLFFNIVYLVTTYKLSLASKPEWSKDLSYRRHHVDKMIAGESWIINKAEKVIASTSGIYEDVIGGGNFFDSANAVPIIPFGIPPRGAETPEMPSNYPDDGVIVLFVGRFERRKGVDLLFECIPLLLSSYSKVYFRLVGDNNVCPEMSAAMERMKETISVSVDFCSRVSFLGVIDQAALESEYAYCDIFVAPSRYESFGLIYLEAMRWGKPCIGANIGGVPDVISVDSGILVEPDCASSLMMALEELIKRDDVRSNMGLCGLRRFNEIFSVDAYLKRLLPVISESGFGD